MLRTLAYLEFTKLILHTGVSIFGEIKNGNYLEQDQ